MYRFILLFKHVDETTHDEQRVELTLSCCNNDRNKMHDDDLPGYQY